MVVVVEHLSLVDWQVALTTSAKDVALQFPTVALKLLAGAEEAGVVGHMEHRHEGDAPGVAVLLRALFYEDGDTTVYSLDDLCVATAAEDGAGSGVGIE